MAQGSSVSYSLRPPPSGFFGSLSSGLGSGLSSVGLGSGLGSGYSTGSLGSQQNMFASASGYQPIMIPSGSSAYGLSAGQLAQAGKWSSYKGVTAEEASDSGALQYNPSSNYNWVSSPTSNTGSSYPSYAQSYSSGTGSGTGSYQTAAAVSIDVSSRIFELQSEPILHIIFLLFFLSIHWNLAVSAIVVFVLIQTNRVIKLILLKWSRRIAICSISILLNFFRVKTSPVHKQRC